MAKATFYSNPKLDFLFGFFGGDPAPTKKDSFKLLENIIIKSDDGKETIRNIYQKNPTDRKIKEFQKYISEIAQSVIKENIIKKPFEVEVILSFSITPSRYKIVDIDNLTKTVLDGLKGAAFEDDSQVSSLICKKFTSKDNGLFIGLTKLTAERKGFGNEIILFNETKP